MKDNTPAASRLSWTVIHHSSPHRRWHGEEKKRYTTDSESAVCVCVRAMTARDERSVRCLGNAPGLHDFRVCKRYDACAVLCSAKCDNGVERS